MKFHVESASFSTDNDQTLLQISLKLHEHRGYYWRKTLSWMIFEDQFPVPRYTAASKIGNSVISLLWQLRCRCNDDHNKFSSLSNTTVVSIFPKLCLWRRSLCSNLGGVDPENLYRATLKINKHNGKTTKFRAFSERCSVYIRSLCSANVNLKDCLSLTFFGC